MGLQYMALNGVSRIKLLGVTVQERFSVEMHVNYMLSVCSQRIFLMKRLRDQGLSAKHINTVNYYEFINTVFHAIIISLALCYSIIRLLFDCGTLWQN